MNPAPPTSSVHLSAGVAELSRPHRQSKYLISHPGQSRQDYMGEITSTQRVNWMHPFLWSLINDAAIAVGFPWSTAAIVKYLQLKHPELFKTLRPQRISSWIDRSVTHELRWKSHVIAATQHGNHPGGAVVRHPLLVSMDCYYPPLGLRHAQLTHIYAG